MFFFPIYKTLPTLGSDGLQNPDQYALEIDYNTTVVPDRSYYNVTLNADSLEITLKNPVDDMDKPGLVVEFCLLDSNDNTVDVNTEVLDSDDDPAISVSLPSNGRTASFIWTGTEYRIFSNNTADL